MQWYYVKEGRQQGPVEEAELEAMAKDGRLLPGDLVWNESMGENWAEAGTIAGLFEADAAAPETMPEPTPEPTAEPVEPAASVPVTAPIAAPRAFSGDISCTGPVDAAWGHMKRILFAPFDLGKWFALGFSAWLATLLEGGGGGSYNGGNFGGDKLPNFSEEDIGTAAKEAESVFSEIMAMVGILVVIGVIVGIALAVVCVWLRSRGKFMLLYNVVNDTTEIAEPWARFKQHGNSLFLWSLGFGAVSFLGLLLLLGILGVGVILPCVRAKGFTPVAGVSLGVFGILLVVYAFVVGYIGRFLEDFIVPIMYRFDLTCTEAWGRFMPLFKANVGKFVVYGLFYFVLGLAAAIAMLLFGVVTCCIGMCLLSLPYIRAVTALPVYVFFRTYSLEYLAQFGPEYDVLRAG